MNLTPGDTLTYTVTVTNPDSTDNATSVTITDLPPLGTTYAGGIVVTGSAYTGTDPATGITLTSIPPLSTATLSWNVTVDAAPTVTVVSNVATVVGNGFSYTNPAETQLNYANIGSTGNFLKTADPAGVAPGGTITYTMTLSNTGTVDANNVVITDPVPVGSTGTPPTLNVPSIPAGGSKVVTFQVTEDAGAQSPISNTASSTFTFTADPANPDGVSGTSTSEPSITQVSYASITSTKSVVPAFADKGDVLTYTILLENTGNAVANNVIITDPIPAGAALIPGSLTVSVPYTGLPGGAIQLTNPVMPGEVITISFKILITDIPNPNPIVNTATASFTYTVDPENPNGASGLSTSNSFTTTVFRNNFSQQISDLIESVALEQAALAAIANAEGAKIQRMAAKEGVTTQELLCLNKSVSDMMDSLAMLEAVLKQKLSIAECQINGGTC